MTRDHRDPHPERVKGPYGRVIVGGQTYPSSWVPQGKVYIQVTCKLCEDTGMLMDDNGEAEAWCDCSLGEAAAQSGSPFGALS